MVTISTAIAAPTPLSLDEFLQLPEKDGIFELVDGEVIRKVSPKFFHAKLAVTLGILLSEWAIGRGELGVEWAAILKKGDRDWVPVPDLTYLSYERLGDRTLGNEACPIPPDLVVEIVSPGQSFGEIVQKATDYLKAGVGRVWIVEPEAQSLTIFCAEALPQTYRDDAPIADPALPDLTLTARSLFQRAGLSPKQPGDAGA